MKFGAALAGGVAVAVIGGGGIAVVLSGGGPEDEEPTTSYLCGQNVKQSGGWTIPLAQKYVVTGGYGYRTHPVTRKVGDLHGGMDLATTGSGSPILAAASGTVSGVTNLGKTSYGLFVDISHGKMKLDGKDVEVKTRYAHLARTDVKVGDKVTVGQPFAKEGASGGVTGMHLHFEIIVNGAPVETKAAMQKLGGLKFDGQPGAQDPKARTKKSPPQAASLGQAIPNPQGVDQTKLLTPEARNNAATIIKIGQDRGISPKGWVVALATALQESALKNLSGGDRDSLGIFQQRPSMGWGTPQQILDPAYATGKFYDSLDDVDGWEQMSVTEAAQAVQRSGHPDAYAKWEKTAVALVGGVADTTCVNDKGGKLAGKTAGERAVNAAITQIGVPYSWGGGGPDGPTPGICCSPSGVDARSITGFDCSSLMQYAWREAANTTLPRTTGAQMQALPKIDKADIQAGDLLFFSNGSHVGMADGKGGMIHAPRSGKSVERVDNVLNDSYWGGEFQFAARPRDLGKAGS